MAQPYVGEIRMFAGNFAPAGWEFCSGQLLSIYENETLFQLIGTTYGGDGESTFALPNLQSRIPIHFGNANYGQSFQIAQVAGTEQETLSSQQLPTHNHAFFASTGTGTESAPSNELLASGGSTSIYRPQAPSQPLSNQAVAPVGGSQPHDNMSPFLCVNFIISLFGIFPSPT